MVVVDDGMGDCMMLEVGIEEVLCWVSLLDGRMGDVVVGFFLFYYNHFFLFWLFWVMRALVII
jgi:hypothetical protein